MAFCHSLVRLELTGCSAGGGRRSRGGGTRGGHASSACGSRTSRGYTGSRTSCGAHGSRAGCGTIGRGTISCYPSSRTISRAIRRSSFGWRGGGRTSSYLGSCVTGTQAQAAG